MEIKITISETDVKVLNNDLTDIQKWIEDAVSGKVDNCWSRMRQDWTIKLMDDPNFTDPIPSNKEDFTSLISIINDYLSVCFHRFIEKGVKIYCHDTELIACSPIPKGEGSKKYSEVSFQSDD